MTYWTIMWITILNGPLEDAEMYLFYPSEQSCLAASNEIMLPYDFQIECEVGDVPVSSIRPKPRPANL